MAPEQLIFGLAFLSGGVVCGAIAAKRVRRLRHARQRWTRTTATIVRLELNTSGDAETHDRVYAFTDASGATIEASPTGGPGNDSQGQPGGTADIVYDPAAPATFLLDPNRDAWMLPAGGAVLAAIGAAILAIPQVL